MGRYPAYICENFRKLRKRLPFVDLQQLNLLNGVGVLNLLFCDDIQLNEARDASRIRLRKHPPNL
ncbi:hypothetical protein D3C84_1141780 [compost metagenome]